jgi:uncharacterized phage-like protein YoqJ
MILAVTGHRPPKLGGYNVPNPVFDAVMRALDEALMRLQPETVLTGLAIGVDQWAASICHFNQIPYIAVIPFEGYDSRWPDRSKQDYQDLKSHAQRVVTLAPEPPEGANVDGLIRTRNRYLVRESEALLAVYNQDAGTGTGQTVNYAMQNNRPVHLVRLRPEIWAQARTTWEQEVARKAVREAQGRVQAVREFRRAVVEERRPDPPRRYSREFQEQQEEFARHFPSAVKEADEEKKAEKLKEDVADLKPRRVIEI